MFEKTFLTVSQTWRVEMNLFTKNVRGFVDFGKQAEPKNPCVIQIHKNVSRYSILYLPDTFWTPLFFLTFEPCTSQYVGNLCA